MTLRVKNWTKFQHFKDRKPPWVKLYREILDDIDWHELDPMAAKVLVMLWLIASEDEGKLPDIKILAFRLRISEKSLESIVSKLSGWLYSDDINVISDQYQTDSVETETETETEKRQKGARSRDVVERPHDVDETVWNDYRKLRKAKRAPITETSISETRKEAEKAGISLDDALRICCARGWQGFKADWVRAPPVASTDARQAWLDEITGRSKRNAIESTARLVG